jgi:hypothetical protein
MKTSSQEQKDGIRKVVKEILTARFENFPESNQLIRNAPFHERFLDAFSEKLKRVNVLAPYLVANASWMHGLNTSLGSGFESLAHILSGGYKKRFTKKLRLTLKQSQAAAIDGIIRDLKSGKQKPNLERENRLIYESAKNDSTVEALEFTVDNFIETDDCIEAVELKSVRPNSGEGRGEKQKILHAKAALKNANPGKTIRYFIGFPFDPTSPEPTGCNKARFFDYLVEFKKFFSPDEVLIADELWDRLCGIPQTMRQILDVISKTVEAFSRDKNP